MTLSELIADWTSLLHTGANLVLVLAGLLGVVLTLRSLIRAYQEANEGRNPTRHYLAAGVAGAITALGVIVGIVSNLVA